MKAFDRLLMLTWVLNVYDIIITLVGTNLYEATELNPLMRAALGVGPVFFVASKLTVHAGVCWTLDRRLETHPKKTWATLILIAIIFTMIALWNTTGLILAMV